MLGYAGIYRDNFACVHFVSNSDIDGSERDIFKNVRDENIRIAYVDARDLIGTSTHVTNLIGCELLLPNAPYRPQYWASFLDDLGSLSHVLKGLVIVLDNAWFLIQERREECFDLVEAFLIQIHHWNERKLPCHLCLQLEENLEVVKFSRGD